MDLKHTKGKVIIKIDLEYKNNHTFESGVKIRLERQYNNLNRRETEPVNAIVVDAEYIASGSEILIHPNAIHDTNKIFNYEQLFGVTHDVNIQYYAIPEEQCFLWLGKDGEWKPLAGFVTALRVYSPYTGILTNIEPTLIKDTLYITSGDFTGKVVGTVKAADYEVIFQDTTGREGRIIRCRHYEAEDNVREEIIMIRHDLTEKLNKGELLIGISPTEAKPLPQNVAVY